MCCAAAAPGVSSHTALPFPGAICKASMGLSFCDMSLNKIFLNMAVLWDVML
jgi:hypothetical protein